MYCPNIRKKFLKAIKLKLKLHIHVVMTVNNSDCSEYPKLKCIME